MKSPLFGNEMTLSEAIAIVASGDDVDELLLEDAVWIVSNS